jgi:hypothetical protein
MEPKADTELNRQLIQRGLLDLHEDKANPDDSISKFFYEREYGRHRALRSKAAVKRNPDTLQCPLCNPNAIILTQERGRSVVVGQGEKRLWRLLDEGEWIWSSHDRIKGWRGAVDACVYFPLQQFLAIQVDGMTHNAKPMSDISREQQQMNDERFNSAAVKPQPEGAGMCVLRLDPQHSEAAWRHALHTAVNACNSGIPPCVMSG